ncbi:MAG: hypothetical protein FWB83_01280 [Treponema sp.]|nr:hypothetical protein [Treponema sp.]
MRKKNIVLIIILLTTGLSLVQAQETVTNEMVTLALFPQYDTGQMLNITPLAYPASAVGKIGMGFLNIFFGLGSWISGDWQNGIYLTLMQGGGIALFGFGAAWTSNEPLLLLTGLPFVVCALGVGLWASGIISGFTAPFKEPKTAQLNDPRNWTVAFFPAPNGGVAGALAFTAHF